MLLRWIGFFFLTLVLGACANKGVDTDEADEYASSAAQAVQMVTYGTIFSVRPIEDSAGNVDELELDVRKDNGEHIMVVQDSDPSLQAGRAVKIVESGGKVHVEAMPQH